MPSQTEVRWSQLKVGAIVLISFALLCTLLFLMTSASGSGVFEKHLMVTAYFDNASGLRVGAPVDLEGVTIGDVRRVAISTDPARKLTPVRVVLKLSPHFQDSLHTDSVASLETSGVLGDTIVEINSQTATGPPLKTGDILPTRDEPSIQDVVRSSQDTVKSVNEMMPKMNDIITSLDKGKGTAGKLINDPALYNRAVNTINQLQTLATNLNKGRGTAGKFLTDDSVYNNLKDTTARLDSLATGLSNGKGSAGKLLTDDTLYNNLNNTLNQTNAMLAQINSGKGGLGLLIKDQAFADHLNDTVAKLDVLLTNVDEGKGTLGKFATDDTAYNNLNKLLTQSSDLVTMIRQDPKKYLTIHMKVF
ncbi:MAG TPA: MlaD family protein [Acidobacteriaceae bacterium]|jgi:phospholipid/cholesterol/gamma-HCH transport system substrate-binding protein|nr:MlaD family protein [Acidobacteriaceae bacterium]